MNIIKGGPNKACAACKYQRKRCSQDCPLAAYFPADKPKMFSNAHRLFGVSNIMRILNQVEEDERDEAMKSIIFESDIRARYPVLGCYGVIMEYRGMLLKTMEELNHVKMLLAHYKESYQNYQIQQLLPLFSMDQSSVPSTSVQIPTPIYNNYGNAIHSGGPYNIENRASSSSSYAHVHDQERCNLDDRFGPYIANKNAMMNASSSSSSYAHVPDQGRFKADDPSARYVCVTDVNSTPIDAKPDLTTMQVDAMDSRHRLFYDHGQINTDDQGGGDAEFAMIGMIENERLSDHNALDISEYNDILDGQSFMECKDALEFR